MSEHVFKFLIGELKTVRIICRNDNCGAVMEVPLHRVSSRMDATVTCPACSKEIQHHRSDDKSLSEFADAILEIQKAKKFGIEFAIPIADQKSTQ